jgi:HNH endonuclease
MFEELLDELRTHSTEWLRRERETLIAQQRNLRTREMAILRVLDERGQVDCSIGSKGESARVVRDKVETARALETLPEIAAVAFDGGLSDEQLRSAVRLADESSDVEWARRAPNDAPDELARMARNRNQPSSEDSRARFAARELRTWWSRDRGMLHVRGQLPDEMGAKFVETIFELTEQMKPAKGQGWVSFEQRAADALVALCEPTQSIDEHAPTLTASPVLQVGVPPRGPAEIAGVPIADSLLEQLRANASIEPILLDDAGVPVAVGKRVPALSPKLRRAVLLRDGQCRVPGCGRRRGLEVHHLVPRSRGGTDDISNLAAVCPAHHRLLVPHGLLALVGNPNLPDGLRLVEADDLSPPRVA